jgi:D-arabinitol dehydrogenase (NADP+)
MATMTAVVYSAPAQFELKQVSVPEPGPGEALLAVEMAGMCGTDLHIHEGGFFLATRLRPAMR